MSFAPGDLVVCVDDSPCQGRFLRGRPSGLRRGAIYTVTDVAEIWGLVGCTLAEVSLPRLGYGLELFNVRRFRPVRDTDISIFTEMLTKAPTEKEPAL